MSYKDINLNDIELKARRMRAEYLRELFSRRSR